MAKLLKIIHFLLIFPILIFAQYNNLKFEHLNVEHGLSNNKIRCILQDKYGFIWIGTHD